MTWAFDFTGRGRIIKGRPVMIEKQLTEVTEHKYGQRLDLALAHYDDTKEPILLKIRYDLRPDHFDLGDLKENKEQAEIEYLEEVRLVEEVEDIEHGPKYIAHASQPAGLSFPYPNGNVHYIIMSRVPGDNLYYIYKDHTDKQLGSIQQQLACILDYVFLRSRLLSVGDDDYSSANICLLIK